MQVLIGEDEDEDDIGKITFDYVNKIIVLEPI